jgi:hypothetical protein
MVCKNVGNAGLMGMRPAHSQAPNTMATDNILKVNGCLKKSLMAYPHIAECAIIQKGIYFLIVMPDLIPAKDGIFDRHPGTCGSRKTTGFPFDFAQGGERVEQRIKSGMTKQQYPQFYDCDTVSWQRYT